MGQKISKKVSEKQIVEGNFIDIFINNDLIYATNTTTKKVDVFTIDGVHKFSIAPENKFTSPWGVCEKDGNIFVTDVNANKMYIFYYVEGSDKYMSYIEHDFTEILQKNISPRGIAVIDSFKRQIFVCGEFFVYILNEKGKLLYYFPNGNPTSIHIASDSKDVLITENKNFVNVYSIDGKFSRKIETDFLTRAIDIYNNKIYTANICNKEISVINSAGTELFLWKLSHEPRSIKVYKNFIYFSSSEGIFRIHDSYVFHDSDKSLIS